MVAGVNAQAEEFDREALELLRRLSGPDVEFREHQLEAIRDLVVGDAACSAYRRPGGASSAVYFVATALLRARGAGRR